ncbi:hypothetical protein H261_10359 [Paramagnetospirillum caucaseum]|uniref:Uncharacterized protein n=1 Tax=Paramagnetospirillum caucaseum TaxID=1244869 RepID=M2ZRW0_9PROT|nr:hypothetical protein [Paramagnetospirillum caucaseum]EME70077.1 hypothetical protein H261_10359 [Paramagnetospirillum caucaseum]
MLENPNVAALVVGSHLAKDILEVIAPSKAPDARHGPAEAPHPDRPICLDDAGLCDHYGHRHHDVDVERL